MHIYTVHILPGADALEDEPVLVREGFNWMAAIFTVFWALWHGMWLVALLLALASGAVSAVEYLGANTAAVIGVSTGLFLYVGCSANDWRRAKLRRRGYRFDGVVAADGIDAALRRLYDLRPPDRALSAASY